MSATIENVMVKPFHFTDIYDLYNTGGELNGVDNYPISIAADLTAINTAQGSTVDDFAADVDVLKNATTTDINGQIQALIDTPPVDEAAWIVAMTDLQSAVIAAVDTGITPDYATLKTDLAADVAANLTSPINASKAAIALVMQSDFNAQVQTDLFICPCPQCGTVGRVATFNPDGSPTGEYVESDLCSGLGYTTEQYQRDPNSNGFILVP